MSSKHSKFNSHLCDNKMTFQECELAILRNAVDEAEVEHTKGLAQNEEIQRMISILEEFIRKEKCICYGGTAINNILPKSAQFYNRDIEIPDYDFYSPHALDKAKKLADIYVAEGFPEVEAKAGTHHGTYKVYVNFIPIADITFLHPDLFRSIEEECITVNGIRYAPANFLRMNMFVELSRPAGDISRWEKVLKRLTLLNKFYPMEKQDCHKVDFLRSMEDNVDKSELLYVTLRDVFTSHGAVFFGGYATRLYSQYMDEHIRKKFQRQPDFDVISEEPDVLATITMERLREMGFKKLKSIEHAGISEIIPRHIEIRVDNEILALIYEPIACHSYNELQLKNVTVNVATIDTMLSFYLAFYFSNATYHEKDRILCMAMFLFNVEMKNRLAQKGLLKRFSIQCIGTQPTLESIRAEKVQKYKELKNKKNTREYDEWFLKYAYSDGKWQNQTGKKKVTVKNKTKTKAKTTKPKGATQKNKTNNNSLFKKMQKLIM